MKIGIDVSRTADKKTGLERYAENLVKALAQIDGANEYFLYPFFWGCFPENPNQAVNPGKPNFKIPKFFDISGLKKKWDTGEISKKLLLGGDVDIVHSPFYAVPEEYMGKIVVTVHDLSFLTHPEFHTPENRDFCQRQLEEIKKKADLVITVSEFSKNELEKIGGLDPARIRVVYEAPAPIFKVIDDKRKFHDVLKKFSICAEFILYAGAIEPRKNLICLVRAFSEVLKNWQAATPLVASPLLVIAGGQTWLEENLKKEIDNLGLKEKIIFTGAVTDEELLGLYNCAGVFVYPSIYEGFGLPPLEAMACGCPVITTDTSSLPEVVGEAALVVKPDDFEGLAEKIIAVLNDKELRNNLVKKGFIQSQKFSWERTAQETLKIYQEVYRSEPNLSDAMIMGLDERGLGEGWQALEKPADFYYRWAKKKASCYLRCPVSDKDLILKIKICSNFKEDEPQSLEILADGEKVSEAKLRYDWNTYTLRIPKKISTRSIKIEFLVDRLMLLERIFPDRRELGIMVEAVSVKSDLANFSFENNMALNQEEIKERKTVLKSFPTGTFQLDITTKCNITPPCIMCYKNLAGDDNNGADISPVLFNKIKDYLKYPSALYICSSGEPLCCGKFWEILENAPTDIVFNTNGLLLTEEVSRRLLKYGKVKTISFSLDATTAETYQKIRGQDFGKVLRNIQRFAEIKKELGQKRPLIFASMVVMKLNAHEILAFPDLAKKVGIEAIEFPQVVLMDDYCVERNGRFFGRADLKLSYSEYRTLMTRVFEKAESMGIMVRKEF